MPDLPMNSGRQSAELLGRLARELSALVRRDVEVAAAERLPTLRRALLDTAALAAWRSQRCSRSQG
jgi:thioester reductase-like protein